MNSNAVVDLGHWPFRSIRRWIWRKANLTFTYICPECYRKINLNLEQIESEEPFDECPDCSTKMKPETNFIKTEDKSDVS